jgi:hypothetical protein
MIVLLKKICCIEIKQIDLTLKTMKGYKRAVFTSGIKKNPYFGWVHEFGLLVRELCVGRESGVWFDCVNVTGMLLI